MKFGEMLRTMRRIPRETRKYKPCLALSSDNEYKVRAPRALGLNHPLQPAWIYDAIYLPSLVLEYRYVHSRREPAYALQRLHSHDPTPELSASSACSIAVESWQL